MKQNYKRQEHKRITAQVLAACVFAIFSLTNASGGEDTVINGHKLWKETISPLPPQQANNKTDQLKHIIEQIRSIQFEAQQVIQQSPDAAVQKPDTNTITAEHKETAEGNSIQKNSANSAVSAVKPAIETRIEELLKDPNTVANPFELAEALFRNGLTAAAGSCYKRALAEIRADDPNTATERCWILFQIGNCLKNDDPNAAIESYAELIRTYPDSPWVEIAKSRHALVEWKRTDKPDKLIEELK